MGNPIEAPRTSPHRVPLEVSPKCAFDGPLEARRVPSICHRMCGLGGLRAGTDEVVPSWPQPAAKTQSALRYVPRMGPCCRHHLAAAGPGHCAYARESCGKRAPVVVFPVSQSCHTSRALSRSGARADPETSSASEGYGSHGAHHRMGGILTPILIELWYQKLSDTGYCVSSFSTRCSFEN